MRSSGEPLTWLLLTGRSFERCYLPTAIMVADPFHAIKIPLVNTHP